MSDEDISYHSAEEWAACLPAGLLDDLGDEELGLLHRHFIWANYQRTLFYEALKKADGTQEHFELLVGGEASTMLLWYSLLWSVIEALNDRSIAFGGHFGADIAAVSDGLRRCRNAVLHVPKSGSYYDKRIMELIGMPDFVARIRRINEGFGRLFLDEMRRRRSAGS